MTNERTVVNGRAFDDVADCIRQTGLIAILRGKFSREFVVSVGEVLAEASLPVVEVALNSLDALTLIEGLSDERKGRLLVGAGTVLSELDVDAAVNAGARFVVSPAFDAGVCRRASELDVFYLPGVLTPTEALIAYRENCRMQKLFPTDTFGPSYLSAIHAPLNDIEFVPTGGVNAANLASYRRAGAVAVGVGSALVKNADQTMAEVASNAKQLLAAWNKQ